MIAVLFNGAGVCLGELDMPEECRLIDYGGGLFVRTTDVVLLRDQRRGVSFELADRFVQLKVHRRAEQRIPPASEQRMVVKRRPAPQRSRREKK